MKILLWVVLISLVYSLVAVWLHETAQRWSREVCKCRNRYNSGEPAFSDAADIAAWMWPILPYALSVFLVAWHRYREHKTDIEEQAQQDRERAADEALRKEGIAL